MGGIVTGIEHLGSKVLHKAEGAVNSVENLGKGAVQTATHGAQGAASLAHGLYDQGKAGLSSVGHFVSGVVNKGEQMVDHALGKNTDTPQEWKQDQSVYKQAQQVQSLAQQDKPIPANLQKQIAGIHDDQTRIRSIADYYGAQDTEMRQKLGVGNNAMTWDGWANKAANLVGNVHQGDGLCGFLGQITGANNDLAQGNKKVFQDIAPVTDSFLKNVDKWKTPEGGFDPKAFQQWVATQPQSLRDDQRFQQGMQDYAQAAFAKSPDDKDAYLTAGNIRLAQHEQRLLQPQISDAMHGGWVGSVLKAVGVPMLPGSGSLLGLADNQFGGELATQTIPGVKLPSGQTVNVNSNVQPVNGHAIPTPILGASPQARQTLDAAVRDSGLQPGQTQGTGAADYSNYDERIKVLTALILANSVKSAA